MLSKRLKELRFNHKMSQKDLAEKLFVSGQAVGKWERDEASPNPETLLRISEIFGITVDELLGRPSSLPQQPTLDQQLEGIDFALYGEVKEMTDDQKQDVLNFARFLRQKKTED